MISTPFLQKDYTEHTSIMRITYQSDSKYVLLVNVPKINILFFEKKGGVIRMQPVGNTHLTDRTQKRLQPRS
jgi:hypothetical protein